jgi:Cdc6-like AAA superfamily ATPase
VTDAQKTEDDEMSRVYNNPYTVAYERLADKMDQMPAAVDEHVIAIGGFIKTAVKNSRSAESLLVVGPPGVGKTSTTLAVTKQLQEDLVFDYVYINLMLLKNVDLVYSVIVEHITGRLVDAKTAT